MAEELVQDKPKRTRKTTKATEGKSSTGTTETKKKTTIKPKTSTSKTKAKETATPTKKRKPTVRKKKETPVDSDGGVIEASDKATGTTEQDEIPRKQVKDIVVERIVNAIQEGSLLPWQKPFLKEMINYITEKPYSGINRWLLMGGSGEFISKSALDAYNKKHKTSFERSYDNFYMVVYYKPNLKRITEKIADELSGKGFGHLVVRNEQGYFKKSFILKYYRVFDIADIKPDKDGNVLEPKMGRTLHVVHTDAEAIMQGYLENEGIALKDGTFAAYSDKGDYILSPAPSYYVSSEAYYRTIFHEMIHSTGHPKRLNRETLKNYNGGKNRSREELIAEMGALFLATEAGFSATDFEMDNSLTYIAGWCEWMQQNPDEVMKGVAQAEKAFNYVMEKSGALPVGAESADSDGIDIPSEEMEQVTIE